MISKMGASGATPAASAAGTVARRGLMSRGLGALGRLAGPIGVGATIGATTSDLVGGAMTGSKTGRAIGAAIGSTDIGKYVANKAREAGEYIGVREPSAQKTTTTATTPSSPAGTGGGTGRASTGGASGATTPAASTAPKSAAPVSKPTVAPATAAKPAAAAPAPGSFKAAYNKAREMGGSKAQFDFGGKKYQAAATKAEYVPMSQQKKVDIGSTAPSTAEPKAEPVKTTTGPEFPKSKVSGVPTPPSRPQSGPTEPKAEPVATSGVNTPNISTPSAKPTAMAPDVGRQSTPSDSGSSVSVKPEPAPKEPEKKQRESGTTLQNVAESVQVGNYKYRII